MALKNFIGKITSVEHRLNLSELNIYDYNPWPYLRLVILNKYDTKRCQVVHRRVVWINKLKNFIKSFFLYMANPVKKEKVDILYFTRQSENQDMVRGETFNRYSDSFKYFFSKKYKVKVLEVCDQENIKSNNKDVTYIDFLIKKTRIKCKFITKIKSSKAPLYDVNQVIENEFGFQIDVGSDLTFIHHLSADFVKMLRCYEPELVFLASFYRPEAMAMNLACHKLGIRVVEYQHGAQNDYHAMYTHWENIPSKGYELIPDTFWMWGEIPKKRIEIWAEKTTKHTALVGGNLWMTYFRDNEGETKKIIECFKSDRTNILIALQGDKFFPEFLLEGIKNNSDEIMWHFRDHPRIPISSRLKNKILQFPNCKIHSSSQMPLYELLKKIDIHITGYSTVAFEAQSFNIPTIFTHLDALRGYQELINKNGLFYVDSLESFNEIILKLLFNAPNIEPDYIISNSTVHSNTLSMLMEGA